MTVYIGSKKYPETWIGRVFYVGRPSPLGNPFPTKPSKFSNELYSLKDSLELYKKWLWKEMHVNGAAFRDLLTICLLAHKADLTLVCWCVDSKAQGECHARIIKTAVEWIANNTAYKRTQLELSNSPRVLE